MARRGNIFFDQACFAQDLPSDNPVYSELLQAVANNGSKRFTMTGISQYNEQTPLNISTLHVPTVEACSIFAAEKAGVKDVYNLFPDRKISLGYQDNVYYVGEVTEKNQLTGIEKTIATVYSLANGTLRMGIKESAKEDLTTYEIDKKTEQFGWEALLVFVYYSYRTNAEFQVKMNDVIEQMKKDRTVPVEPMLILCDNLYRRFVTVDETNDAAISFKNPSSNIRNIGNNPAVFAPTEIEIGNVFKVLTGNKKSRRNGTESFMMKDLKAAFADKSESTRKDLIPVRADDYTPSNLLPEFLTMVKAGGLRKAMLYGPAGSGKSTFAADLACALNRPYFTFTCSEKTDEMDLVSAMIPATDGENNLPSYSAFINDPASAVEMATGEYNENMTEKEAYERIMKAAAGGGSGFKMVESAIVQAAKIPSVLEIQEPACIAKPGTLVKLNSLLDDGAKVTLLDGTVVNLNPETVIILTTNVDYAGCRKMNQSVLSRMNEIIYLNALSATEMTERVTKKFNLDMSQREDAMKMANVIINLQKFCKEEMIDDGVCNYREYENWVRKFLITGDMIGSIKTTVLSKISLDTEVQKDLLDSCVKLHIR